MTGGKRIPKPGEVWMAGRLPRPIVNVHADAVTFTIGGHLNAATLDGFLSAYDPPEPTVVDSMFLATDPWYPRINADRQSFPAVTHRLDLMSDGEFRVVKL